MHKSIALLFTIIVLSSCIFDNSDNYKHVRPLSAMIIESIEVDQNSITFDIMAGVTSSGWEVINPVIESTGSEYHIKIQGKHSGEPSFPVIGSIEARVTLKVVPGNSYTFKFWRLNEAPLDTTILIP